MLISCFLISNTLKYLTFIFIFIFNLLNYKSVTKTQKTIYTSASFRCFFGGAIKASASKDTTSSISYGKLVSRRRRSAYPKTYSNSIK